MELEDKLRLWSHVDDSQRYFRLGDRLSDEQSEWQAIGRPYSAAGRISEGDVRGPRPVTLGVLAVLLAVFTTCVDPIRVSVPDWSFGAADAEAGGSGQKRAVQAVTSTGRQGAYYLPRGHESRALPLLVFFHGTGGKGSLAILRLQALAEQEEFIVLAPDSVSVSGVWIVGQRPGETTEDHRHVMACAREVLAAPGLRVDPGRVLAAGFSVGGNGAAYLATPGPDGRTRRPMACSRRSGRGIGWG